MSDWTALIVAAEAILVSLVVCIALVTWLRRGRQQIAQLQAQVELLSRRQAGVFLEREIANTREMTRRASVDDQRLQLLARLRLSWLQLEQKALQEEGGTRSDTALLARSAKPLLALVGDQAAEVVAAPRNRAVPRDQRMDDATKQARATILMQKEIITRLKEQLTAARAEVANASNSFNTETLDRVSENADAQLASVAKLESELKAARASYQQVSDELARLQSRGGEGGVLVITAGESRVNVASARSLLGDMESAHGESLGELRRMRDTNARQRTLILMLEKELMQMHVGSGEEKASQTLLEGLKWQLRDYENCTVILEMETENLRARIATLNSIIESAERDGHVDIVADLQHRLEELESVRLRSKLFASALKRLAELAEVADVEQALVLLQSGFGGGNRQHFSLLVKGTTKLYWLANGGEVVEDRIRHLLRSVVPVSGAPWSDVKGGAVFVGATLRLFLESGAASREEFEGSCLALAPQLKVIDALLCLLDMRGSQPGEVIHLSNLVTQAARQLGAIDVQHHYLSEENARIGANLQGELSQYFSVLPLTDIQRECVEAMLADFRAEATLLAKASTAVRNNLRSLLQALDVGGKSPS